MTKVELMNRITLKEKFNRSEFELLDNSLINDKDIIIQILKSNNDLFKYVPEFLRDDNDVAYSAIQRNGYPFIYASVRLQNDRLYILEASKNGIGENFQYLSDSFKNDIEIATICICSHDPYGMIEYIGDSLKSNFDFMLLAIRRCGDFAVYACCDDLLSNKEFIIKAIQIYPETYMILTHSEYISLAMDKEIIMLTLNEMLTNEYYRIDYLFDAISEIIKKCEINDNDINDLFIKVKRKI